MAFQLNLFSGFLVITVLIFSIANYCVLIDRFEKLDRKISKSSKSISLPLVDQLPIRELRRVALNSARNVQSEILINAVGKDNKNFYSKLKPEAHCAQIMKVGGKGDGGKVVCNPTAVKEDCTLMSLGLNNQVDYDQAIYNVTGEKCKILAADKDPQNMNTYRIFASIKASVYAGTIPENLTISHIMQQEYKNELEILKIDIEGGEHTGLEPFLMDYYVCQILIEIHGWPPEHLEMLQKISRYGFRMFNIEPNPMCTRCCEYSFINELCMTQFGAVPLAINIPQILKEVL